MTSVKPIHSDVASKVTDSGSGNSAAPGSDQGALNISSMKTVVAGLL